MKLTKLVKRIRRWTSFSCSCWIVRRTSFFTCYRVRNPIWAIGTGKSASQDDAQKCKVVRDTVAADFGQVVVDKVRVQYGGSVKPENVAAIWLAQTLMVPLLVVHHSTRKLPCSS